MAGPLYWLGRKCVQWRFAVVLGWVTAVALLVRVDAEGLKTKRQLEPWVRRAVAYARSLPAKS
jgi:hypothetical protein